LGKTNRASRANKIYKNKDIEKSKKYNEKRNDIITYRLLIFFAIAVEKVGFFIYAMNVQRTELNKLETLAFVGLIITSILIILSLIFLIYRHRQNIDERETVLHSKSLFVAALFLFLADLVIYFTGQKWIPVMTAFAITAIALIYIYYLYQREFFYFSLFAAVGCFFLYFTEASLLRADIRLGFRFLLAVLVVFILVFALILKKGKGKLKSKSFNIKLLEKKTKYLPFFILAAFIAGFAVSSFFFPIYFLYLIFAIVGYFIIVGIYYTVKII